MKKRKERGSSSSSASTVSPQPKKFMEVFEKETMAEKGEVSKSTKKQPVTLESIWLVLLEVQANTQGLKEEVGDLKRAFSVQEAQIKDLEKKSVALDTRVSTLGKLVVRVEENAANEEYIEKLKAKLDSLEQYTRKNSIEIAGMPSGTFSCGEVVINMARMLKVDIKTEDIGISHRLEKRKQDKFSPLIARFICRKKKAAFLKAREGLKEVQYWELDLVGLEKPACIDAKVYGRIFVNENLTPARRRILGRALAMRKKKMLFSAWSLDGKIFIKRSEQGMVEKVESLQALDAA
ncbi:uncharacterized protein LOC125557455 [Nematostella vectensis]|uniref:uncharacterized protein LOC125557455 n=1 Tax=Nematostella vectensis TaxID=45351 RepID=UPI002076F257|nr:uncharacterized protein LOC125557455 [Nematostella vectensis]